jgi:alpha-tubulin suppressor-like RCC1 family protein
MSLGNYHSVAVTPTGKVFTWGRGEYRLGHGNTNGNNENIMNPKQVKSLLGKAVTQVSCSNHTAIVTRGGELFTW